MSDFGKHEDIFVEFHNYLRQHSGGPEILFYGSSHINHLASYVSSGGHCEAFKLAFKKSSFLGVGGTSWDVVQRQMRGEGFINHKSNRGDQWGDYLSTNPNPQYIVIALGSNSVDSFQRERYGKTDMYKRHIHWDIVRNQLNYKFGLLKGYIDEVLLLLSNRFPAASFLYIKIIPRHWWGIAARTLARWLDFYIIRTLHTRYRVKELWNRKVFTANYHFDEQVHFGMLKQDCVHYNAFGNKALSQCVMRSVLNKWKLQKENAPILAQLNL